MYPRLTDIFPDLFGFELPFSLYSFGAMVALAAWTAGALTTRELNRMHALGQVGAVTLHEKDKDGKKRLVTHSPGIIMTSLTVYAVVIGFAGAKLFHILENLDTFSRDPLAMILSQAGFTYYGGLVVAAAFVAWYVKRQGLSVPRFADAVAPGLILGYGIGRMGCHLAGDGDWGIASDLAAKPDFLPTWLWYETYPRNYLGIDLSGAGVYPTPLYEIAMCLVIFAVLWMLRDHAFRAGWLFSLYLVFNGAERFLIEKIRVNNVFDLFGLQVTQAEVISSILMLLGVVGLVLTSKRVGVVAEPQPT
ncbi:MAG: prolipoprotein diacylglyceryl transferase family protein [Bacteroidota bacterium]